MSLRERVSLRERERESERERERERERELSIITSTLPCFIFPCEGLRDPIVRVGCNIKFWSIEAKYLSNKNSQEGWIENFGSKNEF